MPDGQPTLEGKKNDQGKPQLSLVTKTLIWGIAQVMTFGAVKYGRDNWRKGMDWNRPYDALLRHLTAWWDGEGTDSETGLSHLLHAACELMFLIEYEAMGTGHDNRLLKPRGKTSHENA